MPASSELITANEAARILNTTTAALAQLRSRHRGPKFEVRDGRIFYRLDDLALSQTPRSEIQPLLKPAQVANLLAVSESALTHMRSRQQGPDWVTVGRSIRYRPEAVEQFLTNSTTRGGASV